MPHAMATALALMIASALAPLASASADGPPSRAPAPIAAADSGADVAREEEAAPEPVVAAAARAPRSVFFIQRNKNRNEVHYGIRLDEQCRPMGDEPVYNYWLRIEEGPGVTKPVTLFQQAGYGFERQTVGAAGVEVVLRALDARPVTVTISKTAGGCSAEAFLAIAGARARFDKAFVFAEDGLLLPSVKYVDLYGTLSDGSPVRERIDVD